MRNELGVASFFYPSSSLPFFPILIYNSVFIAISPVSEYRREGSLKGYTWIQGTRIDLL